jgi:structural maintenance of chromosome 2
MQGRITKVLNMKPPEILGLIEEAAGTRMYESKKIAAQKTIEKKQEKVGEISKVLAEEITPTLEKLRADKRQYLTWAANNTECERLSRFCIANEFSTYEEIRVGGASKASSIEAQLQEAKAAVVNIKVLLDAKQKELDAVKERAQKGPEFAALESATDALRTELTKAETVLKHKKTAVIEADKTRASALKQEKDAENALNILAAKEASQRADSVASSSASSKLKDELATLQDKLVKVAAGYAEGGEDGNTGGGDTVAGLLISTKKTVMDLNADMAQREMKAKHLRGKAKEFEKAAKEAEKDAKDLQQQAAAAKATLESKKKAVSLLGFDPKAEELLRTQREKLEDKISSCGDKYESDFASVSALIDFQYERSGLGPGWSDSKVKGTVASLLSVARPQAAQALEVCAGGKLYQVVVDNEVTGKLLLEKGKLKRRVTIVPLSQIRSKSASKEQIEAAAAISKGGAVPAISLVKYAPEMAKAMEYVFGDTFICDTAEIARAVCFDPRVRASCVTLSGDVFDPAGTLEGGSPPSSSGGEPSLLRLRRVLDLGKELSSAREELSSTEAKLASLAKASKEHSKLASEVDIAQTQAQLMEQRLANSTLGQIESKLKATLAEADAEDAGLVESKNKVKTATARVKELEGELKNAAAARENRIAAVEAEIAKTKKAAADADAKAKKLAQAADEAACELAAGNKEKASFGATLKACEDACANARAEESAAQGKVSEAEAKFLSSKTKFDAAVEVRAQADKAMVSIGKEKTKALSDLEDAESAVKRCTKELEQSKSEALSASKAVADLLTKHAWIAAERQFFGVAHTDYDFKKNDPKAALSRLRELEKKQAEIERKINKKVIGMIETAEREFSDLTTKRDIIENDKQKIESVIKELDEKKNEALKSTWGKVNKDFGSIFSTLLPGTFAKLQPPDGGSVLDGLEVKVSFNGVWKESLTELSGGQRSLLALSIILSLLLFKPAPMYILDEVDAALDLSHTQNIGHMIRTHFGKSQFIVVSLKQGMFTNANVIFRTKFVDGTSTVTRTVPSGSALLQDENADDDAGKKGAAGSSGTAGKKVIAK